jgi:hypothetical protein
MNLIIAIMLINVRQLVLIVINKFNSMMIYVIIRTKNKSVEIADIKMMVHV